MLYLNGFWKSDDAANLSLTEHASASLESPTLAFSNLMNV